ncbi:MAG: hypothetical protein WCF33_08125 [Pseudonocardiaceae bacterium]
MNEHGYTIIGTYGPSTEASPSTICWLVTSADSTGCAGTLFAALPWSQTPIALRDLDTRHGRITTRTIQVLPAPADLLFPHVNQVWLIERYTHCPTGIPRSAVAVLSVTDLTHPTRHPRMPRHLGPPTLGRSHYTGSATPSTAKTTPPSTPGQGPG